MCYKNLYGEFLDNSSFQHDETYAAHLVICFEERTCFRYHGDVLSLKMEGTLFVKCLVL